MTGLGITLTPYSVTLESPFMVNFTTKVIAPSEKVKDPKTMNVVIKETMSIVTSE